MLRKHVFVCLFACLCLLVCLGCAARPGAVLPPAFSREPQVSTPIPAFPREPLVPTPIGRTSATDRGVTPTAITARASPQDLPAISPSDSPGSSRARFGVGAPGEGGPIAAYAVEQLGLGWYLNWQVRVEPARPGGADFWQMVRVTEVGYRPDASVIRAAAAANPGSIWLIGNEPDVAWQDNATPEGYAQVYHELYHLLKAADPICQVAVAGVSQPTPLRLAYLDRVLDAYRSRYGAEMPVDVWNVHGFVLREERDSWGVSIPPGFSDAAGVLYEIEDHDDLAVFQSQILAFRRWMAEHDRRDRPLVLSEFGILMPADYGFDPARVQAFMYGALDYLSTATDERLGYPQDGNRLVQWWAWYSLADTVYPTGNLFDPETKVITPLGIAFARYTPSSGR